MAAQKLWKRYVLRASAIHGRGVFATSTIGKGTVLIE